MNTVQTVDTQRVARDMVGAHVHGNVTYLVCWILEQSWERSDTPFSYDDIENYNGLDFDALDGDELAEYIEDHHGGTWKDAARSYDADETDEEMHEPDYFAEELRDWLRDNAETAEIFEWHMVDSWLANRLREKGECVLDGLYWGRQATGQAIYMDSCMVEIALAATR